jgi:hypothetical protein
MFRYASGRIEIRVRRIPRPFPANVYGITIWPFVFYEPRAWDDECVQKHEHRHWIDQIKWLVIPWLIVYLALSLKHGGGRNHPFEKHAYRLQDECIESLSKPAPKS